MSETSFSGRGRLRQLLDRRGLRWLLAPAESRRLTRERRQPVGVRPWRGWWIHRQSGRAFAYPSLDSPRPEQYEAVVFDSICHGYTPSAGDVVVDVGAGIGEEAVTFSSLVGAGGRVVCVEAHPRTFERLTGAVKFNGLKNVEVAQLAVADRAGAVRISDDDAPSYLISSVVRAADESVARSVGSLSIPADSLDGVYERFGLGRVDLLKMNIEGAERLALAGWDEALRRTRHVAISCHDFILASVEGAPAGYATFDAVRSAVEDAGFSVTTRPHDPKPWNRYYVYGSREGERR